MRDEIQRGICDLSSKYVQAVGLCIFGSRLTVKTGVPGLKMWAVL